MIISCIVAVGNDMQIGLDNKMLWHIPKDFKHFKETTMGHHMLMGRNTFDSIGKPLPGRTSMVLSRSSHKPHEDVEVYESFDQALSAAKEAGDDEFFVCGGAQVYEQFLPRVERLYLSIIDFDGPADTFFPKIDYGQWDLEREESFEATEKTPSWKLQVLRRKS
jgi:dihydrofolate reductase